MVRHFGLPRHLEVHGFKISSGFGGQLYLRTAVVVDPCFQSDDIADTLNYVPLLQMLKNLSLQQGDPAVLLKMFEKLCRAAPYVVDAHAWTTHHHEPRPSACDLPLASFDVLSCITINSVLGCGEMERHKRQPLTIRIHFDVEALPHLHYDSMEALRESVCQEVEREQCYTIERVAGLVLDTVGSTFTQAQVIKVVVEKPEIGLLTSHDMESASFTMVRRRRREPNNATGGTPEQIPPPPRMFLEASLLGTLPMSTRISQERQPSAETAAHNFRTLSRASTEYDVIDSSDGVGGLSRPLLHRQHRASSARSWDPTVVVVRLLTLVVAMDGFWSRVCARSFKMEISHQCGSPIQRLSLMRTSRKTLSNVRRQ